MVKCFESLEDGRTDSRCPDPAFTDPDTDQDATWEGIEVRFLVFFGVL